MNSIVFISVEDVIEIHKILIKAFGGAHGIRDQGLLISAVNMPTISFGKEYLYSDIYHMAAAYMYYIIKNHAFIDGNKRTGAVVSLIFLKVNNIKIILTQEQVFDFAINIATSKLEINDLANIFKKNSVY